MRKLASLHLWFLAFAFVALGLSTLQLSVLASDAPKKAYAEAFKQEIELTISSLALSGEYDQAIRSWGEVVAEDAWLLVMREEVGVSGSSDMANIL